MMNEPEVVSVPGAHFIFAGGDNSAGEAYPAWPGRPMAVLAACLYPGAPRKPRGIKFPTFPKKNSG